MSYQIIADSCGDFTEEMQKNPVFRSVPGCNNRAEPLRGMCRRRKEKDSYL